MVQDVIRLALQGADDAAEALEDHIHAFNVQFFNRGKLFNGGKHLDHFLNALAESIKLSENIHFGEVELLLIGVFLELALQK